MTSEETPKRRTASTDSFLVHRRNDLIERAVGRSFCPRGFYPNTLVRYARVARKSPQTAECVVVEGVFLEPVSTPALTGKRTGNFAESGLPMRFSSLIHERIQELAAKFPMQRNREFSKA
jgi:hypothetical protein